MILPPKKEPKKKPTKPVDKKPSGKKKLTLKEARFVEAMANPNTRSATEAAKLAGYSAKTARTIANENLTKPDISDAILERKRRALKHYNVTPEEVIGAAVFQMRSSMDDVLDENGSFSIAKARETGAIDLIKKHKETIVTDEKGCTKRTIEVEIMSNQDGRKEVANYTGVEKMPVPAYSLKDATNEELAAELFVRLLIIRRMHRKEIIEIVLKQYPNDKTEELRNNFIEIFAETKKDEGNGIDLIRQKFPKINIAKHLADRDMLETTGRRIES